MFVVGHLRERGEYCISDFLKMLQHNFIDSEGNVGRNTVFQKVAVKVSRFLIC